jgi:hypothetical protein
MVLEALEDVNAGITWAAREFAGVRVLRGAYHIGT